MFNFFRTEKKWENWHRAEKSEFSELVKFIRPYEDAAVVFSSRILNSKNHADVSLLNKNTIFIEKNDGVITGAILLSPEGIVSPVLSPESIPASLSAITENPSYFGKKYITLMGRSDWIKSTEILFSGRNKLTVDYDLLSTKAARLPEIAKQYLQKKESAKMNIIIRKAELSDIALLMPLRKAYEIEEVILSPNQFNEEACRKRFEQTIDQQAVFYAEYRGIPIATTCINSSGMTYHQIGGVYTRPGYRGKGISAMLMSGLAEYSIKEGRDLTLFVKKDNAAALKLYKNCGFKKKGNYRISYIERR